MLALINKADDQVLETYSATASGWHKLPNGDHVSLPLTEAFEHELYRVEAAALSKDELMAHLAALRYAREIGGITVAQVPVATDDRSKTMIMGARIAAASDPEFTTGWKTPDGYVPLTAAEVIAISDAVLAHVQACFDAEAAVAAGIESDELTTAAEVSAAFAELF
jgi:hypothetical protein